MNAEQRGIDAVLAALADPTRRQLLEALSRQGLAGATTLAGLLPVSRQAVVKHLRVLEDAGLVAGARSGREVLYRVRPQRLHASARWLSELAAAWDRRLAALGYAAEASTVTESGPAGWTARGRTEDGPAGRTAGRGGPR